MVGEDGGGVGVPAEVVLTLLDGVRDAQGLQLDGRVPGLRGGGSAGAAGDHPDCAVRLLLSKEVAEALTAGVSDEGGEQVGVVVPDKERPGDELLLHGVRPVPGARLLEEDPHGAHGVGEVGHEGHNLVAHAHEGAEGGHVVGAREVLDGGHFVSGGPDAGGVDYVASKLHGLTDFQLLLADGDAVEAAAVED